MELPLISHPEANGRTHGYPPDQLTDQGNLLLSAHNCTVSQRSLRLFGSGAGQRRYLKVGASLHDFGKATPQFQAHVRPEEDFDGPDAEKAHARLGALATWYVLGCMDAPPGDRLAVTLAVARHHQALPNAAPYTAETLARAFEGPNDEIQAQIRGIEESWPGVATNLLRLSGNEEVTWDSFAEYAKAGTAATELRDFSARETLSGTTPDSSKLPDKLYDRTLRYWSAMTLADKSHAMDIDEERVFDLETLDKSTIEDHVSSIREGATSNELEETLNDDRERARRQVIRGVHEWLEEDESAIATLTLPTGLGKTFSGLSAAFEARDILTSQAADPPESSQTVVYALPFTSIIEQTRAIFENPDLWGTDPQESALTVHHYLSETVVYGDEYDDSDVDDTDADEIAQLLGESWRSGTVLTTFVQLFESLAGPSNRQGLKLPSLDSSLIILDEPQALPKDWWDGIGRLLELLTGNYNARVIAMTATQPSLFRGMETTSLLTEGLTHETEGCRHCEQGPSYPTLLSPAEKNSYFETAERVTYTIDESALSHQLGADDDYVGYEEAADRVGDAVTGGGSVLAICNTIDSSRELTEAVCNRDSVTHLGNVLRERINDAESDIVQNQMTATDVAFDVLEAVNVQGRSKQQGTDQGNKSIESDHVGPLVLTLNSRYRPFDRQVIVEIADRLSTKPVSFVMVSTQAIEAGVDISFETVFRDIAPLDSVVQAAGRCNRSYEWGRNGGSVIVWTLESTSDDSSEPPAHWVYERGATDAGIPGHLRLISDVLSDVPGRNGVPDVEVSKRAVDRYFDALTDKSLDNGEIREHIDQSDSRWLARQSLLGGYETVDVLVAVTEDERRELDRITELFNDGSPEAYSHLDSLSSIRVSIPAKMIDENPTIARIDGKDRSADGVQVYRYTGGQGLEYGLTGGGLQESESDIADRFSVF